MFRVFFCCCCLMYPSWGGQLADSQRELWGSSSEEAAGQSSAAAAGDEQTGGGVSKLCSRSERTLPHCLQTVRPQSKCKTAEVLSGRIPLAAAELVFSVSGRKCVSRAPGASQRFTSSSQESWGGRCKVREAHPTLHCLHWICLWMVSSMSKRSLIHNPYFLHTGGLLTGFAVFGIHLTHNMSVIRSSTKVYFPLFSAAPSQFCPYWLLSSREATLHFMSGEQGLSQEKSKGRLSRRHRQKLSQRIPWVYFQINVLFVVLSGH